MIPTSILVMIALGALAIWNIPDALRWCAAWLLARGEALEAQRATRTAALERWQRQLSVYREDA